MWAPAHSLHSIRPQYPKLPQAALEASQTSWSRNLIYLHCNLRPGPKGKYRGAVEKEISTPPSLPAPSPHPISLSQGEGT